MPFISLSYIMSPDRTSSRMSNRGGERGYLHFVPNLRGKLFSISPLGVMLAVGYYIGAFIRLETFPSIPSLLLIFNMNCC